jgi:hypothetical protein
MPSGKPLRLVMAESVMRIVRSAAAENGVTVEQFMMAILMDEEIDPDAPVYLYLRANDKGNAALLATQDIEPYREHLIAIRDGRQPADPLIAMELPLGSERGH